MYPKLKADAALADLLALAKQGEAYEAALAHAQSLYARQELPDNLAGFREWSQGEGAESEWTITRWEAALLFTSYFGHVPVEAFAAAMTALEQAERNAATRRSRSAVISACCRSVRNLAEALGTDVDTALEIVRRSLDAGAGEPE